MCQDPNTKSSSFRSNRSAICYCQDPDTKSSPLQSNGSAICYLPFILGFVFYYPSYYSLPTSFHSIPVCPLISPFYQHHYTWIIKHQLWLHTDFILSKQQMFHLETQHSGLLYCSFLFYHFIYVSLLSRYIILSFVLCPLVLKINLVSPIPLLSSSPGYSPHHYWRFPSYTSEIGTTKGPDGTAQSWGWSPIGYTNNLSGHSIWHFSVLSPELNSHALSWSRTCSQLLFGWLHSAGK